jgi:hypothetical protein
MKIQILKDVLVEVEKPTLHEVWDKQLHRWEVFAADRVTVNGPLADIQLTNGDVLLNVPVESFSTV